MSRDIEFDVTLWNVGYDSYANPDAFRRIAHAAEANEFDALRAGEHVVIPEELPPNYPFTPDGEVPMDIEMDTYDMFDVLSHLAALTDDIRLCTNVAVPSYRHPVLLAKHVLTLDALTNGRFELGVAPGWCRTEFEVLDAEFEERGGRTDEFLELLGQVYEKGELSFDGEYHSFQKAGFYPIPDDEPPRTWIGGRSGAAIRRVAEYGHGWTTFWERPDEVAAFRDRMLNAWEDFDREGEPGVAVARPITIDPDADSDRPLIGSADEVIEDVEAYAEAGTTNLILTTEDLAVESQVETIDRLGSEVLPSF
jgi:probable F420-dependent oxidoreductase